MFLEILSNASGASGFEGEVRNIIKEEIKNYVDEIKVDRMGNIIAHKKGKGKKVLVDAHMDEVAFIVTGYNEDGTINFQSLGGINNKIIPSKPVFIGDNRIPGVIGLKPIHLQTAEDRAKFSYEDCCLDIGAKNKSETKKLIKLGDYAVFDTEFETFGEGLLKGKALDDRVGCAVLIEILKESYDCDLYAVFSVQEETGMRGAFVSAFDVQPDIGIALEGTICADMPNVGPNSKATELRKGPAISIMDGTSIFDFQLVSDLRKLADKKKIPYQMRKATAGGNDAGGIIASGNGAKVLTVSVPCRYIHSSVSLCCELDFQNTIKLVKEYLKTI